ncbi:MAG: hypothetical protein ACP5K1_03960 [Candidatus Bathyarchaeia archaeon]
MRGFRDHDHVETLDGMVFTVVGNVHPPGRVLAYLKNRRLNGGYRRVLERYSMRDLESTLRLLSEEAPQHLFRDEHLGFEFSAPLRSMVKRHLKPEERLGWILSHGGDRLERLAGELASTLSGMSGVEPGCFGVTGSILLGIHHQLFSDLDLTVYGREASLSVMEALKGVARRGGGGFERFSLEDLRAIYSERGLGSALNFKEYAVVYRRLWNRGLYKGVFFSIHPVKLEAEVKESYGDRLYRRMGEASVEATVAEAADSIFYPGVYRVEDVQALEGLKVEDLKEIVCFEGLYCGIAAPGERLRAKGMVEKVIVNRGGGWHRLVVGSRGVSGYVKPV